MLRSLSLRFAAGVLVLALAATPAVGDPVDSDLGFAQNGGPCHPTAKNASLLDMLTLVNPEWGPILPLDTDPTHVDAAPVLVHGLVKGMHGDTSGDFPATHVRADVNHFVQLDPEDAGRLATGNGDGLIHFEWEAGVYPAWAWAGTGDRVVGLGRWIFDCGHPDPIFGSCSTTTSTQCVLDRDCPSGETCVGVHFGYSSEMHPPYATAAVRTGRGAIVSDLPGATPVPATRADVYVSNQGGGAGDRCILTHRRSDLALLMIECFPLADPVANVNAQDFSFDLPLPPRPRGVPPVIRRRVTSYPAPGGVPARLSIRHVADPDPHLAVTVQLARRTPGAGMPTGFAATILAGWQQDTTPLTHVRLTIDSVVINNALQPARPTVPRTCRDSDAPCTTGDDCAPGEPCWGQGPVKSWQLQAALNGEWLEFPGLASVNTGDEIPVGLVYDQYLPASGAVHLEVNGRSHECVDTMYGKSLASETDRLGFGKGVICLASEARSPGDIDLTYPAPDFGAGSGGTMTHDTTSSGGEGGHCSMTTDALCTIDADCPSMETCTRTGGAFTLRYHIERLS